MIYCHEVTKCFRDFVALDNVTFEVSGGVCALVGPNGAGKSTLLRVLTAQLRPDAGEVRVAGLELPRQSLKAKRIMGVVPEDLGLFDHLTVQEHLELTGPIYGLTKKQTRERTDSLFRLLNLDEGRGTFADECSQGMRKKTALAMALLPNPRLLLLDEPFEGIDPFASEVIAELLTTVAGRGITVFFSSHTLSLVDRLATQVMLISKGRIVHNSATQGFARPLNELYFDLIKKSPLEDLAWLRSSPF